MRKLLFSIFWALSPIYLFAQQLYEYPQNHEETRWVSPENISGQKGNGGKENKGAKGHAWDLIKAGESKTIFDIKGVGIINRIWMTISDRSPVALRSVKIEAFWDGATHPAISAPLGDFFGIGLGKKSAFENALFSDAEGRSFNCIAKMPFKSSGKIVITNQHNKDVTIFYDVNYSKLKSLPIGSLYFHTFFTTNRNSRLGEDFITLPKIVGKGRFIGTNYGIITDSSYKSSWWGEGEVKIYLDGDTHLPTLINTGTEDYIGTAYRQGKFSHQFQGCPISDPKNGIWCFYRFHIPDPVYFTKEIKVAIQQMGGDALAKVREIVNAGAKLIPVQVTTAANEKKYNIFELDNFPKLEDPSYPLGWVNFYRLDNYSATTYFYLDRPANNLPACSLDDRLRGIQ